MLVKKRYSIKDLVLWSRTEIAVFLLYTAVVTVLFKVADMAWLRLPWLPVALIGTAVAFIIGFQNNATYDRIWEARKIWGGIVNVSRSWGMLARDTVSNEHADTPLEQKELQAIVTRLFYRHFAWLTALRHAMRQRKQWEVFMDHRTNREWTDAMHIPERVSTLENDLKPLLSEEEFDHVLQKGNKSTALLYLQSKDIRELKERGLIWEFAFLELENILQKLFDLQGKSERIKNFPYPRQYATLNNYFVIIFVILLPFGVVAEFDDMGARIAENFPGIGSYFAWLAIPFIVIVQWVFYTMERIGRAGENPFEGTANDVPISAIARGIEIDMRQMLDEEPDMIPEPFPVHHNVQM